MVAIFTGAGVGFERGSGSVLGSAGLLGSSSLGRGSDQVFLNAATGNLVIRQQDEFLVGRGPDAAVSRTYNSLGDLSDDNGDNWRQSTDRRVYGLSGTLNTPGSTVRRVSGDGSDILYGWDAAKAAYVATDGAGAHDTLTSASGVWTWTDGDSRLRETYTAYTTGYGTIWRISQQTDDDGNALTFTYTGANLTRLATADGGYIDYVWSGDKISQIVTGYTDLQTGAAATLTRTRYGYDASNRLTTVTVDLSPNDGSVADGKVYVTTYAYDGTSKRVQSIAQSDGSLLSITYGSYGLVETLTETIAAGTTSTTTIAYGPDYTEVTDGLGRTTRFDFASGNVASPLAVWGSINVAKEAATINGAAATKYTVQSASSYAAFFQSSWVEANRTLAFGLTLQGVGSVTSQSLGLYSDQTGWGPASESSARIVSGPGQLQQLEGGQWVVTGLSTTEGTRVEISRTYRTAQWAGVYVYVDQPGGWRGGASLIVANPTLFKSSAPVASTQLDLTDWLTAGLDKQAVAPIQGMQAYKYTVQTAGAFAATAAGLTASKGDTVSWSVSLQADGFSTSHMLGIYGADSLWGSNDGAKARIVSGPGTITQYTGGLFTVSGLSTTQVTRITIDRVNDRDEIAVATLYPDLPNNLRAGASVIAMGTYLEKRLAEPASARQLVKITAPAPVTGGAAQVVQFAYDAKGNVTTVTDAAGNATTRTYDVNGNVLTETDRLGSVVTRTYGSKNELLTETRSGSDKDSADAAHTTRYAYDAEGHLRYVVGAEGMVTEYRYDRYGQQVAKIDYPEAFYDVSGLASGTPISEATLNGWVASLPDRSWARRTNSVYDARGNLTGTVSYSTLSKAGEAPESALAIAAGANTTVTQESDGLYRITKTGGVSTVWDADAQSVHRAEGDFVLQLRPAVSNTSMMAGVSVSPAASASYTNPQFGLWFNSDGSVWFMESGAYSSLGTTYAAGDSFWLTRAGDTISYYKGATFDAAVAAGSLRSRTGTTGPVYFDSSLNLGSAAIDIGFTPRAIATGANTTVAQQPDGLYRVTKTGGAAETWNADARSTVKADGDFVLRLRPRQSNANIVGGIALSPAANTNYTNPNYGFYFDTTGSVHSMESGSWVSLGRSYQGGDNFWLVRTGTTINYFAGATLEEAMAAGSLRTHNGVSGTFYFDSSIYTTGTGIDVDFAPAPILNGVNATVVQQADGLYRVTKTGGTANTWDTEALSRTKADGDFVLRLRPPQDNAEVIAGVGKAPAVNASYANPDFAFYFGASGVLQYIEAGVHASLGAAYAAGDNFWLVRTGSTIAYYRGATLEAAMAAGALRSHTGISGTFHFDSSLYSSGGSVDVEFTPTEATGASSTLSRTTLVYDQSGRLLSRFADGEKKETYVYDGLGRLTASTDAGGGTTSIVFNDAATQTVVTMASGLVTTSTYNKAGHLLSVTESGSNVPAGATTTSEYDKLGRLRVSTDATGKKKYFVYDKVGRLVAEVLETGTITEYRYDANDRLTGTLRYVNTVSGTNLTTLQDPNSTIEVAAVRPGYHPSDICTWQVYDKEGRVTATMDSGGSVKTFEYDKSGRLVKSVGYFNRIGSDTYTTFKTSGTAALSLPQADAARDSIARNFYDRDGRLIAALDGEGYLTRNVYDRAGQLIEQIAYFQPSATAHRAAGTLAQLLSAQASDANDRRTRFVYDSQGQLRFEIDGLNQVVEHDYNAAGKEISRIGYAGAIAATSDYSFDNVKALVAAANLSSSAETRKSWIVYDASGRIAYSIGAEGAVTGFSYDNVGQVTKTVQFAAVRATTRAPALATMTAWAAAQGANAGNRITRNYYSARGELRFTVDAEGYVGGTEFDAAGRTVREVRWDAPIAVSDASTIETVKTLVTGGAYSQTLYGYNAAGLLTDVWDAENSHTQYSYHGNQKVGSSTVLDGNPSYHRYDYDGAGRVVAEYPADGTPEEAEILYAYDGHGNLVWTRDGRGNETSRTYDRLGRIRTETNAATGIVTYAYNAFGEAATVTDARGNATTMAYDKLGRLVSETDALNGVTTRSYDVFGDLKTVTRGTATTGFDYDRLGRLVKATDAEGKFEQYTLDAFGNRISVRNKIEGVVDNVFDRRGLLVAETIKTPLLDRNGAQTVASVINKFEYDARGNLTKRIEAFGRPEVRTTTYLYDKADRLVETRGDAVQVLSQTDFHNLTTVVPTEKIKYDARGRVIETSDALGARTLLYYDQMDRVSVEIGATGTYSKFTYDANGNMLTRRVYAAAVTLPATAGGATPSAPSGAWRETAYTYDVLNRLKTTSVADIRTGAWNGTAYATSIVTVTTSVDYDANGNVVRSVDGNGAETYSWYDQQNRKTAELDAEGYLTAWTLDGEGNVLTERRHAAKWTGTVSTAQPPAVATDAKDRVTEFEYDRNGRRLFEKRLGVEAYTISTTTGALTAATGTATIGYLYNGLGQVTRKTEANGDVINYSYDTAGRLVEESRSAYLDHNAASVTPTVRYGYDSLNDLVWTRQGGEVRAAGDRDTVYQRSSGRLDQVTDAAGNIRYYRYDAGGNVVRESYERTSAAGTGFEAILYTRDVLGRVATQAVGSYSYGVWTRSDIACTGYNAYGEVERRGINLANPADPATVWQERFAYDNAGRLYASNSGDGVWRYFLYDKAGNRTAAIESEGADLADKTLDQALAIAAPGGTLGGAFVDGINVSFSVFDKRGLETQTRMPQRELGGGQALATLTASRTYNAFGETLSETDARGYTTDFAYNAMGRLVEKKSPQVSVTSEAGVASLVRPTESYRYDISGRMIGSDDANGNRTTRLLLAGTGHGAGAEAAPALVIKEFHPDQGVATIGYDLFGDARKAVDEIGRITTMSYDAMGRLTEASRPGGLVDHYGYDQLGQRTSHWNSFLGASNVERTGYDLQGRVTSQTAFGGDVTATAYAWDGTIANTGMGIYGGWTQTVTYANSKTSIEKSDLFGREVWKQDLGLHVFASAYDRAGRVTSRSGSGDTVSYSWLNTGLAAGGSTTSGTAATYAYDASGNRTAETTTRSGVTVQSATATWDALGRMTAWDEAGNASTPAAHINYAYDAVGNVRRTQATYYQIDSAGNLSVPITQDYWNKFDAMNRLVLAKGGLVDGAIVRGNSGVSVTYDAAGQRITTTRRGKTSEMTWRYTSAGFHTYYHAQDPQYQGPGWAHVAYEYEADRRETFAYNADGTIDTINIAQQQLDYEDGTAQPELGGLGAMGADRLLSDHSYDAMGRLTHQVDYKLGGGAIYDRELTYNAKGQLTLDVASTLQGTATTMKSRTEYTFGSGTGYALGAVVTAAAQNWKNDDDGIAPDTLTTTTYAWWDGAVASSTSYDEDTVNQNNALFTSTYSYDGFGSATGVSIDDGRDRTVTIVNDLNGQAIRRDEADLTSAGDPHEIWYRFGGRQLGYTGNNGTLETDYQTTAQSRTVTQGTGAFRNGATLGASYGDFALGYAPVTSFSDAGGGSHTVQTGETLSSIAANLWGDASLWYKLAEANGMTSANALMEGQSLIVPAGVNRNRYDASTFRPYDPSDAIGDASPTNPKMPKKNKCGTIGQIMIAAVAIAVTAILPHVAGFFATTAGSILGGMIGSAAGQGFGIAIGAQEKFDWKAVAMAGVTAGVSKGLDKLGAFGRVGLAGNGFAAQAARGAITAGLSQGVGVATGLQSKFDFAGVAAAGLSQGVSSRIGGTDLNSKFMRIGADELVSAASRSVLTGTSFGDNLVAVLPSVIGRTIGESIEGALSRRESPINVNSEATFAAAERVFAGLGNEAFTSDFGTSLDGAGIGMGAAFEPVAGAGGGQSSPRAGDVGDSSERETHEDDVIVVNGDRRRATEPAHSSSNGVEVPSYDGIRGGRPNGTNHLAFFLDNLGKDLPGYFQQREYQFFGPGAGDPGRYVAYVDSLASDATEWQFRRIILPVLNGWAGYGAYGEGWSAAAARAREIVAAREAGFNADWNQQLSDFGRAYVQIGQIANPIMAAASGLYDVFNNGVDPIEATTSLLLRRIRFLSNPISGQRERVLTNIAASRRARASSNFSVHVAQTDQTRVGYAADHWEMTNLSAGERIFGGLPGQSPYYTNAATISSSTGSRRALWESLQVRANPELGYRPMVGEYEVIRDIRVPFGTASANPSYGAGGATQFFVRDYGTRLRLVRQLPLGE